MASRRQATPAPNCRRCTRLAALRRTIRRDYPDYHAAPVTAVGAAEARLLIVGLAPGLHGANATGRPFSGDASGALLFETLHRHGFANQPFSTGPGDGLVLQDCRVTNAVKCLPPGNRPTSCEIGRCATFLAAELVTPVVILALGGMAHRAVIRALDLRQTSRPFAHRATHALPDGRVLVDSYHCSRYNQNTRRLTPTMFDQVFVEIDTILSSFSLGAS